jgi:hypothetical protein
VQRSYDHWMSEVPLRKGTTAYESNKEVETSSLLLVLEIVAGLLARWWSQLPHFSRGGKAGFLGSAQPSLQAHGYVERGQHRKGPTVRALAVLPVGEARVELGKIGGT